MQCCFVVDGASPGQQDRQAEEVVPALQHHIDPAVEDGATGRKHAVQCVRRVLQVGLPSARILVKGKPYVQPVRALLQLPGAGIPVEGKPYVQPVRTLVQAP